MSMSTSTPIHQGGVAMSTSASTSHALSGHAHNSPLKLLRDDSVDGTLSPVSSKSAGTDTEMDVGKKSKVSRIKL